MSSPAWMAVVCGVAGGAVGMFLPQVGLGFTGGRSGADRQPRRRTLLSVVTAASTMAWFGFRHAGPVLPAWCWMVLTGVCLAIVDIECRRLPRPLVSAMGLGGLLLLVVAAVVERRLDALVTAIAAAGLVAVVTVGIALAAPRHIGGGDVTLYPVLALYLGWWGWPVLVGGMVAGAILTAGGAIILLVTDRAGMCSKFAAGPTVILGAFVAIAFAADTGSA